MLKLNNSILALGQGVLDVVLPPRCFSCGDMVLSQGELCSTCWTSLTFISKPQCHCCGFPFEYENEEGGQLCGSCIANQPPYGHARSVFRYDDVSKRLILALKHFDKLDGVDPFGRLMWRTIAPYANQEDIIVPVPLHPKRLFKRRFNQAAVLAKAMAKASGLQLDLLTLIRVKPTLSQGGLSRMARQSNVKGAFAISDGASDKLKGRSIILVDDVHTTGATVNECARVLLNTGASSISVVSLARVVRK